MLATNHRTTREINEAAISFLDNSVLDNEELDNDDSGSSQPKSQNLKSKIEYIHSGPPPAVRAVNSAVDEAKSTPRCCLK
jgi:hypothetical protein